MGMGMVDDVRRSALFLSSSSTSYRTPTSSTSTPAAAPTRTPCRRGALRLARLPSRPRRTGRRSARADLVRALARAAIGATALGHLVVDAFGGLAAHAGRADWAQAVAFDLPCATVQIRVRERVSRSGGGTKEGLVSLYEGEGREEGGRERTHQAPHAR